MLEQDKLSTQAVVPHNLLSPHIGTSFSSLEGTVDAMEREPNQIPVVSFDWQVVYIAEDIFDWKDYYKRTLHALGEPPFKIKARWDELEPLWACIFIEDL